LARPQNQLPDPLKAQIISVAIWVERHSKLAEQGEASAEALIQVNESIMKGLAA
jgi:flagellar protein FlaF